MRSLIVLVVLLCGSAGSAAAQTEESVAEKSRRLGEEIEALRRQIDAGERATPAAPPAPVSQGTPLAGSAAAGAAAMIAEATGRAATQDEVARFLSAHEDASQAFWDGLSAYPASLATARAEGPVAGAVAYAAAGGHVYCDFRAVLGREVADAMMAADPVIGARCEPDEGLVMRRSAWDAVRAQVAFAMEALGEPAVPEADLEAARVQFADYFATSDKLDVIRAWARADAERARLQARWDALGATQEGRAQREAAVARAREADGDYLARTKALYDAVARAHAMAGLDGTLAAMQAQNGLIARESWILMHVPGDPAGE